MVNGNDYELIDEPLEHEGCIRIPYPGTAYAWPRVFFAPAEKRFFYDFYSTGAIADDELRYHGSEDLSLDEVKRLVASKWPPNEKGVEVLNEILEREFPGESLVCAENVNP